MKKTHIAIRLLLILFIVISMTLYYENVLSNHLQITEPPKMSFATIGSNPTNEMIIVWETSGETRGTIEYGIITGNLENQITENKKSHYHRVLLTNLEPNQEYFYHIIIDGEIFSQGRFKTAPIIPASLNSEVRFGIVADTQPKFGAGWHSASARAIANEKFDFLALVGDFVEDGVQEEWYDYFNRASVYLNHTPLVPVRGNHEKPRDFNNNGEYEYLFENYFNQTMDKIKGTNEYDTHYQFYYSFNWSNVHFQILHFPEMDIDDFKEDKGIQKRDYHQAFTEDHLQWIKEDLKNAQDFSFRISMFHVPITGAGFYGENFVLIEELLPILHEYNVTATFHGHAHHYGRGVLENPIHPENPLHFFNVGTGGGLADVGLQPVPENEFILAGPLYTEIIINGTTMNVRAKSFDGIILDNYKINVPGGN